MNIRRLIAGLSFLCMLIGVLLVCFIPGGFFNAWDQFGNWWVNPSGPLHITGFVLLIVGAVGFVVVFSLKKP
jgi:hypothetical protein